MQKTNVKNLVLTAFFIALGLLVPMAFHAFGLGKAFLPMHIPILLCGLICGLPYGAFCGAIVPLLSALLTGMPVLFPTGVAMMFELCIYGLLTGFFYRQKKWNLYLSLILAMLLGRAVSGVMNAIFMGLLNNPYGFSVFLSTTFAVSLPGIILQLVAVPLLVVLLEKARVIERPKKEVGAPVT